METNTRSDQSWRCCCDNNLNHHPITPRPANVAGLFVCKDIIMFYDDNDADTLNLTTMLTDQASRFCSEQRDKKAVSIVVHDWEYLYDKVRYGQYRHREGEAAERKIRWPFHRIVAGAWAIIDFPADGALPVVTRVEVLDRRACGDVEIVEHFFAALNTHPNAIPVSWGGEFKDLQVLRMVASVHGLRLPRALRMLSPFSPDRADLNMATATKGHLVHLPEYARACDIPTKAVSSKDIGPAALAGDWPTVHEQVLSDIFTISIIAARHLASHGLVSPIGPHCDAAILDAFIEAFPVSPFLTVACGGWAAHRRSVAADRLTSAATGLRRMA